MNAKSDMPTISDYRRQLPIPAPAVSIVDMEIPGSDIYEALFNLSQSIGGQTDLGTLCNSLAGSL